MTRDNKVYDKYPANISRTGLSIYDPIEVGNPDLWIPTPELEMIFSMSPRSTSTNSNRPVCSGPLLPANCQTTIATTAMPAVMIAIFFILRLPLRSDCLRVFLRTPTRLGHRPGVINESLRTPRA